MIMPISTSGIGNMDIGQSQGSKAKNKAEEAAADAFASLMNMTSKNVDDNPFVQGEDTNVEATKTEETYAGKEEYSYENKNEPSKVEKTEEKGDSDFSSKTPDKAVETTTSKYGEVQKEEVVEVAASVLIELKEIVMEELNITPEELDSLLQDMNLNLEDLLDVGNMKEFILQFKDSTNVDLLIDENLADLVKDVTAKLNDLISEHQITNVDDFINMVKGFETEITKAIEVKENPIPEEVIPQNDMKIVTDNVEDDTEEGQDKLTTTKTAENVMNSEENVDITISDTSKGFEAGAQTGKDTGKEPGTIINNLNQAIENAMVNDGVEGLNSYTEAVTEADIVRQIIDDIKVNLSKDVTSIEVQLNPENLGKVQVHVATEDGVMQAKIIAETEAAKNAIENSLALLKETFENQDLKVDAIEVMVGTYEFFNEGENDEFQNENNNSSNKTGSINLDDVVQEEVSEEEQLQIEIMKAQGNRVSYSI